jgi:Fe-S oxidoreductase
MDQVFAPGCGLLLYKPELADKVQQTLAKECGVAAQHLTCCHHAPGLPAGTEVINVCPGCDRRYRSLYEGVSTRSLWEVLAESRAFPFPDYGGKAMAIHDACPTRDQDRVHDAVRTLLARMNIRVVEPKATRSKGTCCGDTFYGTLPAGRVKELMAKRAAEMPEGEVVVYCVSCIKSMHNGGKKPQYLVDLLFGEETVPGMSDPDRWHAELDRFIGTH